MMRQGDSPAGLRREDVVARLQVEHQPAHDAHDARCRGEGHRQHDVEARGAQTADDDDVEHHHREREQHVGDERDHLVPPAAEIAGGHAHQHADDVGDGGGERRPDQHPLRAPDQAGEDVAALVVGAEPEEVALAGRCAQTFWNGAIAWLGSSSGRSGASSAITTQNSRISATPSMPSGLSRSRPSGAEEAAEPAMAGPARDRGDASPWPQLNLMRGLRSV